MGKKYSIHANGEFYVFGSMHDANNKAHEIYVQTGAIVGIDEVHLKCNWHKRPLKTWNDLPTDDVRREFSYLVDQHMEAYASCDTINDEARFFEYRGAWYDYYEFSMAQGEIKSMGFDGFQSESYYSAVVVAYFDREGHEFDDEIIVGYVHW